jgi:hypothetical protein
MIEDFFAPGHVERNCGALSVLGHRVCASAEAHAGTLGVGVRLRVNGRAIYEVVNSAFYDVARFKEMHLARGQSKLSDGVKRAAYFAKWILKMRPIEYRLDEEAPAHDVYDAWLEMMNEHLALEWGLACIGADLSYASIAPKASFREDTAYALHYREIGGDGLIAMFKILSDMAKSGMPSPLFEVHAATFSAPVSQS